jgi:hypothetical protein
MLSEPEAGEPGQPRPRGAPARKPGGYPRGRRR